MINNPRQNLPENKCDWAINGRCLMHPLQMITCNRTGCKTQLHHACQSQWEFKFNAEPAEIMTVCWAHHPHYASNMDYCCSEESSSQSPNIWHQYSKSQPRSICGFFPQCSQSIAQHSLLTGKLPMPLLPPLIGFNDDILDPNAAITTAAITTTLAATAAVETAAMATNANTTQPIQYSDDVQLGKLM